ncbi:SMP-30/gluconolactonase/LRE family protein [Candidatus Latescibacterota bacterium]
MNRILYGSVIIIALLIFAGCATDDNRESAGEHRQITLPVVAEGAIPVELCSIDEYVGERSKSEGPVADSGDNVYFSNPYGPTLFKWSKGEGLELFTGKINGPNGLDIDSDGNIIACEAINRRIVSLAPNGTLTVLTDSFGGKKYHEPNDLFIDSKGGIYFSDPYFHVHYEPLEQQNSNLYYITPDRRKVIKVIGDMTNPNGICSSPDGSLLYVIETGAEKTFVYDVNPDGTLSGRRLFVPWGIDGLTVDSEGNVYITGKEDYVNIYNPAGEFIEKIVVPITKGHTSNVCFGVKDRQTLFITAGNSLFSIKMNVKGFL